MKKICAISLILAAAAAAQAAFQYEVVQRPTFWRPGVSVWGNEFSVRITEGSGTLYL